MGGKTEIIGSIMTDCFSKKSHGKIGIGIIDQSKDPLHDAFLDIMIQCQYNKEWFDHYKLDKINKVGTTQEYDIFFYEPAFNRSYILYKRIFVINLDKLSIWENL